MISIVGPNIFLRGRRILKLCSSPSFTKVEYGFFYEILLNGACTHCELRVIFPKRLKKQHMRHKQKCGKLLSSDVFSDGE